MCGNDERVIGSGPGWELVRRASDLSTFVLCDSPEIGQMVKRALLKHLTSEADKPATEAQVDPWALLAELFDAYEHRFSDEPRWVGSDYKPTRTGEGRWFLTRLECAESNARRALEAHRAARQPAPAEQPKGQEPGAQYRTVASHAEDYDRDGGE